MWGCGDVGMWDPDINRGKSQYCSVNDQMHFSAPGSSTVISLAKSSCRATESQIHPAFSLLRVVVWFRAAVDCITYYHSVYPVKIHVAYSGTLNAAEDRKYSQIRFHDSPARTQTPERTGTLDGKN